MNITLFIDIATALVGITVFSFVAIPRLESKEGNDLSSFEDLKLGTKYTFGNSFLRTLLLLFGVFVFLCVPAGFMATLFVTRTYGNTYLYMTVVEVVGFIGMTLGGVLISIWGGFKKRTTTLFAGVLSFGILAIAMGAVNNFIFYLVLMAVYGIALTMIQTSTTTLIQENPAPEMQGRVFVKKA